MRKKWLTIFLMLNIGMVMALSACGSSGGISAPAPAPPVEEMPATAAGDEPASTESDKGCYFTDELIDPNLPKILYTGSH